MAVPSTTLALIRSQEADGVLPPACQAAFEDIKTRTLKMTKLEAIVQPNRFEQVKEALIALGVEGMTISEVRGHGRQKGHTETYRGREYETDLLPKVKIELVLEDKLVDPAIDAIIKSAATGKIGDGKIFLSKVDEAIRIRNQERGVAAL
jgi:nitrogen regulatory protein P-II 1